MRDCCLTCKKWQGTKHSKWGDCHYICAELNPMLLKINNLFGWKFRVPFDPHDVKYFEGQELETVFKNQKLMDGLRILSRKEEDIKFILSQYDAEIIGERTVMRKIYYYQTHKDMEGCDYHE